MISYRRTLFALAAVSAAPLLAACPDKKPPPVVEAAAPPPPENTAPTELVPIEPVADEDAGVDAGPPAKKAAPQISVTMARLKQCCSQLRAQARALGNSPESGVIKGAAAQCDTLAKGVGPGGNVPELGVIKNLLAGHTIPPVCRGF